VRVITGETLAGVREAFALVQRESDLHGWGLDDQIISPFSQESGSTQLIVSLLRGTSERTSIAIDLAGLTQPEGDVNVSVIATAVRSALRTRGLLPG
jgi:hypothetical protein